MTAGFNPKDPRQNEWMKREQDKAVKDFDRGKDIQRDLDKSLPGEAPGNPPGSPFGS